MIIERLDQVTLSDAQQWALDNARVAVVPLTYRIRVPAATWRIELPVAPVTRIVQVRAAQGGAAIEGWKLVRSSLLLPAEWKGGDEVLVEFEAGFCEGKVPHLVALGVKEIEKSLADGTPVSGKAGQTLALYAPAVCRRTVLDGVATPKKGEE
jgi:hypothetical protein